MLRLCGTIPSCLPAHRCFSSSLRTHRVPGVAPPALRRSSSAPSAAAASQGWWSHNRRHMLQAGFAGLVSMAVFGSSSTALAASRVEQALEGVQWPAEFPFSAEDFQRYDESPDTFFYGQPRYVTHIDDKAIAALTKYYEKALPPSGSKDVAILDMCSSWISHYPKGYSAGKITGTGMNPDELSKNPVLTDWDVKDLNVDPKLPYADNSYDVITNVVSVDYLSRPLEIFKEMHRVLKPGGLAIMSFSNRCFPTKAISLWTATDDATHAYIVGAYFHYSVPGGWTAPKAVDIGASKGGGLFGGSSDPMYVVYARKEA